LTHITL